MLIYDPSDHRPKTATFSPCRLYRYQLWRRWQAHVFRGRYAMFVGLNPSTADETNDDPTIRRCIQFAKDWGYDGLCMTNIFAFRATDPKVMKAQPDPIGPDNDAHLMGIAEHAGVVVAAWGIHGAHMGRHSQAWRLLNNAGGVEAMCLGTTAEGFPKHPLYLAKTTKLTLLP